jgi:hypothetical protein
MKLVRGWKASLEVGRLFRGFYQKMESLIKGSSFSRGWKAPEDGCLSEDRRLYKLLIRNRRLLN